MGKKSKDISPSAKNLESGFYMISGVVTIAGEIREKQPAFFDSKRWWLIGWDIPLYHDRYIIDVGERIEVGNR